MKSVFAACLGLLVSASAAAAADLPQGPPPPAYPVKAPIYAPQFSWTGLYIGLNGGGGFGRSYWDSTGGFDLSGGMIGGTIGYNYQFGPGAVVGIEADGDWTNMKGSTTNLCPLGCQTDGSWLSTVRGRFGYAFDRFMPFVSGGAAFGDINATTPGFTGNSSTNVGWTAGGGVEFAVAPHWSLKAEYLYVDLGNFNCGISCGAAFTDNVSLHMNLVRGGVNYHF